MVRHDLMESPIGVLILVMRDDVLIRVSMDHQAHLPDRATFGQSTLHCADQVREELDAYFAGDRRAFSVDFEPTGTAFQRSVQTALAELPFGEVSTYGAIAKRIGNPSAVRAVGGAIGRNPLSIIVPCHRVSGADGSLTGFAGGLDAKRYLLAHEGVVL